MRSSSCGHAVGDVRRWDRARVAHALERVGGRVALGVAGRERRRLDREELLSGQQLPEQDAADVDVGASVERLAARLLGRQVAELAEDDPGRGVLQLERRRREAEVGQLDLAGVRQQHVGRRDVAVNQVEPAERVRVAEPARQLLHDVDRDLDGEGHAPLRAAVPGRQQILAFDEVHREVDLIVAVSGIEDRDQVAVRQPHRDHRLVAEALHVVGRHEVRQDLLDDAELFHARRTRQRQIELAHTAARERLQQHVGGEPAGKVVRLRHGGL